MSMTSVDLSNLREFTDGDAELEAELFAEFKSSSADLIDTLGTLAQAPDQSEDWRKAAHALKGISVNLGAFPLGELAKAAQENCENDAGYKSSLLDQIKAEHSNVTSFLDQEVS